MKPLTELITEWDNYTGKAAQPTVADFCEQYLRKKNKKKKETAGEIPPQDMDGLIAELVGRMSGLHTTYAKMMLKELPDVELEWFYLLNIIKYKKEAKKTDIISLSLLEQSTGIDILNRMKSRGLITEKNDPADKRARLISITAKGNALLTQIGSNLYKVTYLLYNDIKKEDKQAIIRIFGDLHTRHQQWLQENKQKKTDEVIEALYGREAPEEIAAAFSKQVKQREKIMAGKKEGQVDDVIRSLYK